MLAARYPSLIPSASDLRVMDAFVVRYDVGAQASLPFHQVRASRASYAPASLPLHQMGASIAAHALPLPSPSTTPSRSLERKLPSLPPFCLGRELPLLHHRSERRFLLRRRRHLLRVPPPLRRRLRSLPAHHAQRPGGGRGGGIPGEAEARRRTGHQGKAVHHPAIHIRRHKRLRKEAGLCAERAAGGGRGRGRGRALAVRSVGGHVTRWCDPAGSGGPRGDALLFTPGLISAA